MIDVLLIEDNEDDVELTRRAFERVGLAGNVRVARDGVEGMDYLFSARTSIQLILLDLNLPKIPGLEVLRQIRLNEASRALPIVVLTASRREPDLLQSFTMGISDYLIKPVDADRLVQVYRKYTQGAAA